MPDDAVLRELRYYAGVYDDLHAGETYKAITFVDWLLKVRALESRKRRYNAPAGRPGQIAKAEAA